MRRAPTRFLGRLRQGQRRRHRVDAAFQLGERAGLRQIDLEVVGELGEPIHVLAVELAAAGQVRERGQQSLPVRQDPKIGLQQQRQQGLDKGALAGARGFQPSQVGR